jgi:hypothetical protein
MTEQDGTPQQRRQEYLSLAADAEATASKSNDPESKKAWIELARNWAAMAKEVSPDDH